jgi:hypothetical protein
MYGIIIPKKLEIGNLEHIHIKNVLAEDHFIKELRKTIERDCPLCEFPLTIKYASEAEQYIEWECTAICKHCNSVLCEYTDVTNLEGICKDKNKDKETLPLF